MPCNMRVFFTGPLRPPLKSPLAANLCCGNFFMKKTGRPNSIFLAASRVEKKFFRVFSFALKLFSNGFFCKAAKIFAGEIFEQQQDIGAANFIPTTNRRHDIDSTALRWWLGELDHRPGFVSCTLPIFSEENGFVKFVLCQHNQN